MTTDHPNPSIPEPAPTAPGLAAEPPAILVAEPETAQLAGESDSQEAEAESAETVSPEASPAASPEVKSPIRTTIKFTPEDEAYVPGQCTVSIVLTLQPNDGHPDGRQVLIGVRSHDEEPLIGASRLNNLPLPGEIVGLLERYELNLPALGQARAERETQEKAKQVDAESKRKAAQARKTAKSESGKGKAGKKSLLAPPPEAIQPATPTAPPTAAATDTPPAPDSAPGSAAQISLFG
jgi:hypothetical protein